MKKRIVIIIVLVLFLVLGVVFFNYAHHVTAACQIADSRAEHRCARHECRANVNGFDVCADLQSPQFALLDKRVLV